MVGRASAGAWVQGLLDAMPGAVALVDAQQVVTVANPALERLVGGDPVGRALPALLDADLQAALGTDGPGCRAAAPLVLGRGGARGPWRVHVGGVPVAGAGARLVTLVPAQAADGAHLGSELAEALRGGQVVLHYQPVVRLTDGHPVLLEALARWEHPSRGLLRPAEFLASADTVELSRQLGARVLREACHAAAAWGRDGGEPLQVAVNLSERQLLQPGTVALVREALAVAHCPPEQLLLEVPEAALQRDPDAAGRALRALKDVGVGIGVDDLGTGSSALSYLRSFPVDLVKVDGSLVAGLGTDAERSAVVASLVSLARTLGVRCVAEGVETAAQLSVLRRLGCDLGQGYVFSRPMEHAAVQDWLARARPGRPPRPARRAAAVSSAAAARALELQEQSASLHTIAARLNAEGHRNVGGRRWHHTSVASLIARQRFPDVEL